MDPVDFGRLEAIGSPELIAELVAIFVDDIEARLTALERAHAAGDRELLARGAHAIKGSCSNLGAVPMAALAEAIEAGAHRAESVELGALRDEFARVRVALARWVTRER